MTILDMWTTAVITFKDFQKILQLLLSLSHTVWRRLSYLHKQVMINNSQKRQELKYFEFLYII